jgi:murein L,D-transpeptidase YcbB/YkuD
MSNIKTYSLKKDGNTKLSANFTVREFRSPDSDTVKIDLDNVVQLQKIRDHFGATITINSGYRTAAHNAKVGGASKSYHMLGQAADIVVKGIEPLKVALYADSIGLQGIIYYPGDRFCHIDTRTNKYRAISVNKVCYAEPQSSLKHGSSGGSVKWLQYMLTYAGYKLTTDGSFGAATKLAVKDFQRKCGLTVDGIFGANTRAKLKEALM